MSPISFPTPGSPAGHAALRPYFSNGKGLEAIEQHLHDPSLPQVPGADPRTPKPGEFDNVLGKFVNEVNAKQLASVDAVTGLLTGQNVQLHQAMIAMEEASVSFQLMVEVRNKLLEGYQELVRMQV